LNAAEREGHICNVPVDRQWPVHTAWDLGIDDAMAIWCFQVAPGVLHIVDYFESSGHGFDHYCRWLDEHGYHGTDWVPTDAKMRELGSPGGRTRIETLISLGRKPKVVKNHKLMDGINAGRKTILRAKFDEHRCAKGLEALRAYKAEWDEDARTFKTHPKPRLGQPRRRRLALPLDGVGLPGRAGGKAEEDAKDGPARRLGAHGGRAAPHPRRRSEAAQDLTCPRTAPRLL
jgi:hypothetical protein